MKIGKYTVCRTIYEGHLATVFEALEPAPPHGLGRRVAVKLCTSSDDDVRRRFAREAEMTARVGEHPNITNAYDLGFHEDAPFLVEEYLSGEDLRQKIHRGEAIDLKKKLHYLLQIAKGLEFAHSKDILHRDIKPENVRVLERGQVKIMDFGLGKVTTSEATRLTLQGSIMGTLGYLAPEQLQGKADHRTDIFSYGVLAYELLTYRHAFAADTLRDQIRVLLETEPTPLAELCAESVPELEALIHRCLAKAPDERHQNFKEVVAGLRATLQNLDLAATATTTATKAAAAAPDEPTSRPGRETQRRRELIPRQEPKTGLAADEPKTAAPRPALHKPAGLSRKALLVSIGSVATIVALIWTFWPARDPVQSDVVADASISTGTVFVDAFPWGKLVRVLDQNGAEVADMSGCVTPCTLALPQGIYRFYLSHPELPEREQLCEIVEGASTCRFEAAEITAIDYFKGAGWWD